MEKNTRLTLKEFENYCMEHSPKEICFDTRNHLADPTISTLRVSLVFTAIKFLSSTDSIALVHGEKNLFGVYENYLHFNRIKHIIFREEIAGVSFFTIVCGSWQDNKNNFKYNISLM